MIRTQSQNYDGERLTTGFSCKECATDKLQKHVNIMKSRQKSVAPLLFSKSTPSPSKSLSNRAPPPRADPTHALNERYFTTQDSRAQSPVCSYPRDDRRAPRFVQSSWIYR